MAYYIGMDNSVMLTSEKNKKSHAVTYRHGKCFQRPALPLRGCGTIRLAAVAFSPDPVEFGGDFGTTPPLPFVGMEETFVNHPEKIMGKLWTVVELVQFFHPLLPRRVVSSLPRKW